MQEKFPFMLCKIKAKLSGVPKTRGYDKNYKMLDYGARQKQE